MNPLPQIQARTSIFRVLTNAALIWNTIEISKIIEQLRLSGEEIKDEHIAGISPLIFRHIIPSGTYHFREVIEGDTIALNTLE